MKRLFLLLLFTFHLVSELVSLSFFTLNAQTFSFDGQDKSATKVTFTDIYSVDKGFGYDLTDYAPLENGKPCFFSVLLKDGNYKVTLTIGSRKQKGNTTIKAEQRRLFLEDVNTKKGETKTYTFCINKRGPQVSDADPTKVEVRGRTLGMNWDEKLTFEFNGSSPVVSSLKIEPADDDVTTLWLCGNSTVVDQDFEPWASWGQMIPRWFDEKVSIANYAESGWRMTTLMNSKRLKQMLPRMKSGDYIFVEFGHNDQKEKQAGAGAYYNFATQLKTLVDMVRQKGVTPVFITPTQRRNFYQNGKIRETHGDYPDAMRWVAKRENVQVIEVHDMTRTLFETLGVENSKNTLVHYPANTFPGQVTALADNTHFNNYGAYEISKMVVQGMKQLNLPFVNHVLPGFQPYDPAHPDDFNAFALPLSPLYGLEKPAGN